MRPVTRRGIGDPLVLIHGFTQTQRSWGPVARRLERHHQVVTLDAPGHGEASAWAAGLWEGAEGMVQAAGRGTYIGYSMGGRFALHAALLRPEMVPRLVLISATAGIDDPPERAARRTTDEVLAQRVANEGVAAFIAWWLAQPMWASLDPTLAGGAERLTNTAQGLASSLRLAGAGRQSPAWDRLGELNMPVLVIAGQLDGRYAALAERLGAGLPRAEVALIPGAGHACHLERPDEVAELIETWLEATRPGR